MKLRFENSVEWLQNYIALRQLAFERAMDRFDVDRANIACAQKEWAEKLLNNLYETTNQNSPTI